MTMLPCSTCDVCNLSSGAVKVLFSLVRYEYSSFLDSLLSDNLCEIVKVAIFISRSRHHPFHGFNAASSRLALWMEVPEKLRSGNLIDSCEPVTTVTVTVTRQRTPLLPPGY